MCCQAENGAHYVTGAVLGSGTEINSKLRAGSSWTQNWLCDQNANTRKKRKNTENAVSI